MSIDTLASHCCLIKFHVISSGFEEELTKFFFWFLKEILESLTKKKSTTSKMQLRMLIFGWLIEKVLTPASIALTNADVSIVQLRTVSVRPSRNRRVIEASYVWEKLP